MPDWETHIKWAVCLGVRREVADFINRLIDTPEDVLRDDATELGETYRRNPELLRMLLIGHDWGKNSKAQLDILKAYCRRRFGEEGVLAAELHHILDYLAYIRDPRGLASLLIASTVFHETRGMSIEERILFMRRYYRGDKYREQLERLTRELAEMNYDDYKRVIIELVASKASEWRVHDRVIEFVMRNLDGILEDIDAYLKRKHRRTAQPRGSTLDKWLR